MELRINWNIIGNAKEMIQKWLYYIRLPKLQIEETKPIKSILKRKLNENNVVIKKLKF